jgi:hypothetical protein
MYVSFCKHLNKHYTNVETFKRLSSRVIDPVKNRELRGSMHYFIAAMPLEQKNESKVR